MTEPERDLLAIVADMRHRLADVAAAFTALADILSRHLNRLETEMYFPAPVTEPTGERDLPERLPAPGDFLAQISGSSVVLNWGSVPGAVDYVVSVDGAVQRAELTGAVVHFLIPGSHTFAVRAYAQDGFPGIWSDSITLTIPERP